MKSKSTAAKRKAPKKKVDKRKKAPEQRREAKSIDGGALPIGIYLSINEIAREFHKDHRTIQKLLADLAVRPVATRQGHALYRLADVLEIERRTPDGVKDPTKFNPVDRKAHYQAESEMLRVNKERGELMTRADYESELARCLQSVTLRLDTITDRIEAEIGAAPSVLEGIERILDEAREEMYREIAMPEEEKAPDDPEEELDAGAAA